MANPFQVTLALAVASATNIAASQSPGAGAITLNGSVGTGNLDTARRVIVTSGGNDTGITFTITGKNRTGNAIAETITGASGGAAQTTQDFLSVSSVTHTGSVASTVTVGTSGVASTPWFVVNRHTTPVNVSIGVVVSGTINYTAEYTYDDPNSPYTGTFPTTFSVAQLTTQTATADALNVGVPFAVRITQNSFTNPGNLKAIMIQAGLGFGN